MMMMMIKNNENLLLVVKNSARMGFLTLGSNDKTILGARQEVFWATLL
jgi:hypothetical protein